MKEWTDELKDPVFRIPDGYFEKLNDRLDQRIASSRQMRGRTVRMRVLRWASAAAVIAALAIGIGLHLHTQANSNPQIALSGEEARDIANEYLSALGCTHEENESDKEPIEEWLEPSEESGIIYIEQNNIYVVDGASVEEYICDHYNLMELATL